LNNSLFDPPTHTYAENLVEVYPNLLIHGTISAATDNCFAILELNPHKKNT